MVSTVQKDGIEVKGHVGKWYVISESCYKGEKVYLLEHTTHGDEAACLIVNDHLDIIAENVWNGFSDLDNL